MSEVKEYYVDDLVYKFDDRKRIQFGVVIESYEGSDTDDFPALQKGQILVLWANNKKQVCKQTKVSLMNRSMIPGDIVRRLVDGVETQKGYCKTTKQVASAQVIGTTKIIDNVCGKRLPPVKLFDVGNAVCLGNKFGRIQIVHQLLKMQSKCGSIVEISTSSNYHNIKDYWSPNEADDESWYPGQTILCTPMNLNDARWIKKNKTMKKRMDTSQIFTIQTAEYTSIEVWWYNYSNNKGHTEFCELSKEDIKKLKVIPYCTDLEVGDRSLIKLRSNDTILKKNDWIRKQSLIYYNEKVPEIKLDSPENHLNESDDDEWLTEEESDNNVDTPKIKLRKKPTQTHKFGAGSILPVDIVCTHSSVTVVWQDGTEEKDIPTTELYYSLSLDEHEFFPGEWVTLNSEIGKPTKYGVVQKAKNLERTAEVKWFDGIDYKSVLSIEEISVYDLKKDQKFVFRPGSIVKAKPTVDDKMGKVIDSYPQGFVKVQWLDGSKEDCWPQHIELIPDIDDYEFSDYDDSDDDDDDDDFNLDSGSWETQSIESFEGDVTDQINMELMATRVEFIRDRIVYLNEVHKQYSVVKDFNYLKDLICIYYNSRYLDKLLDTSFFSLDSKHFQVLHHEAVKLARSLNVKFKSQYLLVKDGFLLPRKIRSATEENFQKIMKLESRVNLEIEKGVPASCPSSPVAVVDDISELHQQQQHNLTTELLIMLRMRFDLVYAEIISRLGGRESLTVLTDSANKVKTISSFQPPTPDESFSVNSNSTTTTTTTATTTFRPDTNLIEPETVSESFCILDEAPESHRYYKYAFDAVDLAKFLKYLTKEYKLLTDSLPAGVWVKTFSNRMDLLSVMIRGPAKTPYEDGLFFFDIQLSEDYPLNPPLVHYITYSREMLNPNLYVEGKVCVSLLGTWKGRGSEVWGPNSTLLQLIVSIQGLILVAEPYYNEAGYEKQTHTQQGYENSRTYNELVLLKIVQSMTTLLNSIPEIFKKEVLAHFQSNADNLCQRLLKYCNNELKPDYPLLPVSKGLKLSLNSALKQFQDTLKKHFAAKTNC